MPLMPIRGHPSGRGGSQALNTASLGREGAGLEVPTSGTRELQKTWGKGRGTEESRRLDPTLVSALSNW